MHDAFFNPRDRLTRGEFGDAVDNVHRRLDDMKDRATNTRRRATGGDVGMGEWKLVTPYRDPLAKGFGAHLTLYERPAASRGTGEHLQGEALRKFWGRSFAAAIRDTDEFFHEETEPWMDVFPADCHGAFSNLDCEPRETSDQLKWVKFCSENRMKRKR